MQETCFRAIVLTVQAKDIVPHIVQREARHVDVLTTRLRKKLVYRRTGRCTAGSHLLTPVRRSWISYTLKMEAIRSSETSVNKISTRRHIPEDDILHSHGRENLKSHILRILFSRSQWPSGLRHELSLLARTLESWARIPLKAWMFVCVCFYSVCVR
jgi:hypothetical protein